MTENIGSLWGSGRPPRLPTIFQRYDRPLYFVTFCTKDRMQVLNNERVHAVFRQYAEAGSELHSVAVGRYTIMPEHVHVFVRGGAEFVLSVWVRGLKRMVGDAVRLNVKGFQWQSGFFDHLIRSTESYSEKWEYVRQNPVRAGLVSEAETWPFSGEIARIELV